LLHLMILVGSLVNYGKTGEKIRKAPDPIAELLKEYPGLGIILNQNNLRFSHQNGRPTFTFAARALKARLAQRSIEIAA